MKRLSVKTVRKALEEAGFRDTGNSATLGGGISMVHCGLNAGQNVYVRWTGEDAIELIKFHNGRWREKPHVHVVSYYRFPLTKAELAAMIRDAGDTYARLCGTRWDCPECNGTGLRPDGHDCAEACWYVARGRTPPSGR